MSDIPAEAIAAAERVFIGGGDVEAMLAAAAPHLARAERERYEARLAVLRAAATDWAAKAPADDWGDTGDVAEAVIADVGREILRMLDTDVPGVTVKAIRKAERERCASLLTTGMPLAFLRRHGLEPGAGCGVILSAAAAEIRGAADE